MQFKYYVIFWMSPPGFVIVYNQPQEGCQSIMRHKMPLHVRQTAVHSCYCYCFIVDNLNCIYKYIYFRIYPYCVKIGYLVV